MSEGNKSQNVSARFVSFDGTDENGIRAEVFVNKNRGKIKKLEEKPDKGVVDVHFDVPNLTLPIHGWTGLDNPLFKLIMEAKEKDEEVDFRLETQRKYNVDRSIPIQELRENQMTASKNTRVILAGVNDILSDEAVTNPKEDPKPISGGRYPARDSDIPENTSPSASTSNVNEFNVEKGLETLATLAKQEEVRQTVLDAMAAQLILQGATVEQINEAITPPSTREIPPTQSSKNFAVEAPSWKEYNSDGKLNLGSAIIGAGVGIETVISDILYSLEQASNVNKIINRKDVLNYYTTIIFAICDRIQAASYGPGFQSDRSAASHSRIRGLVYEIIRKTHPIPLHVDEETGNVFIIPEEHDAWVVAVGQEGIERFKHIVAISTSPTNFKPNIPSSLLMNNKMVGQNDKASQGTLGTEKGASEPVSTLPEVNTPDAPPAPSEPEIREPEQDIPAKMTKAEALQKGKNILKESEQKSPVVEEYVYRELLTPEMVEGEQLSTPETVERFKTILAELGLNINDSAEQVRISKLLKFTFGTDYNNARKIPDFMLENFIDYYESAGAEALDKAIREALK